MAGVKASWPVPEAALGTISTMIKWTGKAVGGALGLLAGGPIGAAIGLLLGHQYDEQASRLGQAPRLEENLAAVGEMFFRGTFRVMGHLAKADGRVSESEIAAARTIMSDLRLNPQQVRAAVEHFTLGKQPDFNLAAELASLSRMCQGRHELPRIFLEIQVRAALAGNNVEGPVRDLLRRVAARLDVSMLELAHIEAVARIRAGTFRREPQRPSGALQVEQAYRVLECASTAPNDEVVKAYRRQLSRHHPDKLKANGLPDSMIEHAKQRTQQIIEAYELIRERRGI
jgi:DnaJ like chaperone protein